MTDRPLRLGITSFAAMGGSGIVATELGLNLAAAGHEIHFISTAVPVRLNRFSPNVFFHEVEAVGYPAFPHVPYSLALASKMTEVARYHDLDLLHVHYAIPHAASAYMAKQMLAPKPLAIVTTLHGTDITLVGQEPGFKPMTKFVIEQSDAVTAVSDWLRVETLEKFEVSRPIEVISNFVDTAEFRPRPELRRSVPFNPEGRKVVMHASNFRKVKNTDTVVRVFAQVRRQADVLLAMVGDGPQRGAAEALARELGVADDVVFLGAGESMAELLAMADVLHLPSAHESFGLVALEAMSTATPPVVTNQGGPAEVVEDGKTGFLLDPSDIDGQTEAILRLCQDEPFAQLMGQRAREVAQRRYCIRCVIHDYVDLYERLIGLRGPGERARGTG